MKNELTVRFGDKKVKCILMDGFYDSKALTKTLHKHNYTEFHIVSDGEISFELENRTVILKEGNIYAVPSGVLHRFVDNTPNMRHVAFLAEHPIEEFCRHDVPIEVVKLFFEEIKSCASDGNHAKIEMYIALLCAGFFSTAVLEPKPITDQAFIIYNFFNLNYNKEIGLSDLAKELHFSEKQTARLVQKYTGMNFKQAVRAYRMSIARLLRDTTDKSFAEISEHVGYKSYNGFWKAYKAVAEEEFKSI